MEHIGIALTYKGKILKPDATGYLGNGKVFEDRTNIELMLTVPPEANIQVYENEKGLNGPLRQLKPQTEKGYCIYSRKFRLFEDRKSGISGALYPRMSHNNTNRLVVVRYEEDGGFDIWEVGLFAQNGEIYFARQLTRTGWNDDTSKFPKVEKHPETLPDPELSDNVGRVEWFNLFSGCGVVVTNKGPAHIYWGEIKPHEGLYGKLLNLETGSFIVFSRLEKSDAQHSIPYQIKGGATRHLYFYPVDEEIKRILAYLSSSAEKETGPKSLTHSPFAGLKI